MAWFSSLRLLMVLNPRLFGETARIDASRACCGGDGGRVQIDAASRITSEEGEAADRVFAIVPTAGNLARPFYPLSPAPPLHFFSITEMIYFLCAREGLDPGVGMGGGKQMARASSLRFDIAIFSCKIFRPPYALIVLLQCARVSFRVYSPPIVSCRSPSSAIAISPPPTCDRRSTQQRVLFEKNYFSGLY
jgi:hypothetical protein